MILQGRHKASLEYNHGAFQPFMCLDRQSQLKCFGFSLKKTSYFHVAHSAKGSSGSLLQEHIVDAVLSHKMPVSSKIQVMKTIHHQLQCS